MSSNYDVGTRAWQPDAAEGWVASEVTKKQVDGDNVILTFKLENGEVSSSRDYSETLLQNAVIDTASTAEGA
jgi:myosin-5